MTYFNTRDIAAIALSAALWGVLNAILSPAFFSMTRLPFLCDLIGFSVLIFASWWIRKPGAITLIGLIATAINFMIVPAGVHFLGFTVASVFFDVAASAAMYGGMFKKSAYTAVGMMGISVSSGALAGYLIGTFFMTTQAMANWGGVLGWAGLHAIGGVIGGIIGAFLVTALKNRKVTTNSHIISNVKRT